MGRIIADMHPISNTIMFIYLKLPPSHSSAPHHPTPSHPSSAEETANQTRYSSEDKKPTTTHFYTPFPSLFSLNF